MNKPLTDIEPRRVTAVDILARKGGEPIVALTSYHAHTARIIDPFVDFMLVGDSLGMVMHGFETTLPVTLEMMILQGQAVMRGSRRALVVVDLPFGTYEEGREAAFRTAARVLKARCIGRSSCATRRRGASASGSHRVSTADRFGARSMASSSGRPGSPTGPSSTD